MRPVTGLVCLLLACAAGAPQAAEPARIVWNGWRITVETGASMPLVEILERIARETGVAVQVEGDPGLTPPIRLVQQPLDKALLAVTLGHDTVFRFASPATAAGEPRLHAAWIMARHRRLPVAPRPARGASLGELAAAGEQGLPRLARMLASHPDVATRERAARALLQIGSHAAALALSEGLHDPDPTVRLRAAQGLARIKGQAASPRLQAALALERDPSVRALLQRLLKATS